MQLPVQIEEYQLQLLLGRYAPNHRLRRCLLGSMVTAGLALPTSVASFGAGVDHNFVAPSDHDNDFDAAGIAERVLVTFLAGEAGELADDTTPLDVDGTSLPVAAVELTVGYAVAAVEGGFAVEYDPAVVAKSFAGD